MSKVIVIIALVMISGCEPLSRSDTIAGYNECLDGGLVPRIMVNGITNKVVRVDCAGAPKDKK